MEGIASNNPERFSPFVAALQNRDEDEQLLLSASFLALEEPLQEILVGKNTLNFLDQLVAEGLVPETHIEAVSKLIGIIALDDSVSVESLPLILQKLDFSGDSAVKIAEKIAALLAPILLDRAADEIPSLPKATLPPMTRPTENGSQPLVNIQVPPPPTAGPSEPKRNILDLRNKPQT